MRGESCIVSILQLQIDGVLEKSRLLTSDEAVAIVVSEMTDDLLGDIDTEDEEDIDAATLDEIIDRVRASYEADTKSRIQALEAETSQQLAEANTRISQTEAETARLLAEAQSDANRRLTDASLKAHAANEQYRQLRLALEGRASRLAHLIAKLVFLVGSVFVCLGVVALIVEHHVRGTILGACIILFLILEFIGVLHHMSQMRSSLELFLLPKLRQALGASQPVYPQRTSILGLNDISKEELPPSGEA